MNPSKWPTRRGAILIVILAFVALIASLLGAALRIASSSARATAVFADSLRADELGRAAIDLVVHQASSSDPEAQRGGAFVAQLSNAEIHVDYVSESARADINLSPAELIGAVFRAAGAEQSRAAEIIERIILFRQPRGKAEAARLEHLAQIGAAWGVSQDLIEAVRPALTAANGTAKVDPSIANRLVVAALLGGEGPRVDDFLERRRRGFTSEADAVSALASDMRAFAGFNPVHAYRAVARVRIGRRFERRYEFIVAPPDTPNESPRTILWRRLF